ncbi:hypothetical protein IJJ54_01720 [Candidatus Saccharibacteria bacterium]|nr:hypothetical protein [Candidatus Saccharibacteria bacterium]
MAAFIIKKGVNKLFLEGREAELTENDALLCFDIDGKKELSYLTAVTPERGLSKGQSDMLLQHLTEMFEDSIRQSFKATNPSDKQLVYGAVPYDEKNAWQVSFPTYGFSGDNDAVKAAVQDFVDWLKANTTGTKKAKVVAKPAAKAVTPTEEATPAEAATAAESTPTEAVEPPAKEPQFWWDGKVFGTPEYSEALADYCQS